MAKRKLTEKQKEAKKLKSQFKRKVKAYAKMDATEREKALGKYTGDDKEKLVDAILKFISRDEKPKDNTPPKVKETKADFDDKVKYYVDMNEKTRIELLGVYEGDDKDDLCDAVFDIVLAKDPGEGVDNKSEQKQMKSLDGLDLAGVKVESTDAKGIEDVVKQITKVAEKGGRGVEYSKDAIRFMAKQMVNREVKREQNSLRNEQKGMTEAERKEQNKTLFEKRAESHTAKVAKERADRLEKQRRDKLKHARKGDSEKSNTNEDVLEGLTMARNALNEAIGNIPTGKYSLLSYVKIAKKNVDTAIARFF